MKTIATLLYAIFLICAMSPCSQARIVSINGTLLNQNNPSGNFPEGGAVNITIDLDDSTPNHLTGPPEGRFYDCISHCTVSVPSKSFTLSGTAAAGHILYIYTEQAVNAPRMNEPSVVVEFDLDVPGDPKDYVVKLEWFQKPGSPPPANLLTQDLSTASFRLVSAKLSVRKQIPSAGAGYMETVGFGWERAGGIAQAPGVPAPVGKAGYDRPVVFGDSLSASRNTSAPDPAKYFDGGYTNGPVWPQYLSWELGMKYEENLNFSRFGGITLPPATELLSKDMSHSLGLYWSNTAAFSAIFGTYLAGDNPEFFESLGSAMHEELLRTLETGYTLGLRDFLILNVADVTFAPLVKNLLNAGQQGRLRNLILSLVPDYGEYRDTWFTGLFPGMRASVVNPNTYLDLFRAAPGDFGITNINQGHLTSGPTPYAGYFGNPGSDYFFWDDSTPTTKVQSNLAGYIFADVFSTGVPTRFRCELVNRKQGKLWLFAAGPPAAAPLELQDGGNLMFGRPPLRSFTTTDPFLFFIVPDPATPSHFYRIAGSQN